MPWLLFSFDLKINTIVFKLGLNLTFNVYKLLFIVSNGDNIIAIC